MSIVDTVRRGAAGSAAGGLRVEPTFCPAEVDPFTTVEWDRRSASIKDETGGVLFEQHDCEVPASWSQLATNVVVSKYFMVRWDRRARGECASVGPSCHAHDCRLGVGGRLFCYGVGCREFLP